jgi:dTMP kinase
MSKRYSGDESKKDIHEKDRAYLDRSRLAAEYCAEKLGWQTIHCIQGNQMRTIEDIAAEILSFVK